MMFESTIEIGEESLTVNWLMYKSYEAQRDTVPNVAAERWKKIYINQPDYERVYQELNRRSVHKGYDSVHNEFDSVHKEKIYGCA